MFEPVINEAASSSLLGAGGEQEEKDGRWGMNRAMAVLETLDDHPRGSGDSATVGERQAIPLSECPTIPELPAAEREVTL